MATAKRREGDRMYQDGLPIRVFLLRDGKEQEYNARVSRWTSNDELAENEKGEVTGKVKLMVLGVRKDISGRVVKIGNRYQFIPLNPLPPAKLEE